LLWTTGLLLQIVAVLHDEVRDDAVPRRALEEPACKKNHASAEKYVDEEEKRVCRVVGGKRSDGKLL